MSNIRLPVSFRDCELLALGQQLTALTAELTKANQWVDTVTVLFEAEIDRFATWPRRQTYWTDQDAKAFWEVRCRIEKKTEIGAAFVQALNAYNDLYDRQLDPLCSRIKRLTASTPDGRAVKRLARAVQTGTWQPEEEESD